MIAHRDADCVVPVRHSQHLADALTEAGVPATLTILPGARHEDPDFMRTLKEPTFAFLDQTLRQQRRPSRNAGSTRLVQVVRCRRRVGTSAAPRWAMAGAAYPSPSMCARAPRAWPWVPRT